MQNRIGIIAGGGALPGKVAKACLARGLSFLTVMIKGQADKGLADLGPHFLVRLGETEKTLEHLKAHGVDTLVLAGSVRRPGLLDLRADRRTLSFLGRLRSAGGGDDALLRALAAELEDDGFSIMGAHELVPDVLAPMGIFGRHAPDSNHLADIRRGLEVARTLGKLDVGQSVVIQQGIVLGVEASEGTDWLLGRCKRLKRKGAGGVLVKISKPGQDNRFDLPTVGPRTLRMALEAGLDGIAVEAGKTIVIERDEMTALADAKGLFITGIAA